MTSPITRRPASRLLAVQLFILLMLFIGCGLVVVPTAACDAHRSGRRYNPNGQPPTHPTGIKISGRSNIG
ncbi:hypothetical protein GUJ93_ZPchr0012g20521 [Zizania palustris]|uniref:Uncharacterized protein n=1 Tax=Zizania palustris TaxID=103762 RepID=A0A8J5WU68_ZIZPA|nr:hypothetical protein GUJ93_ZPchr0012g20521 [Zizania palustris]